MQGGLLDVVVQRHIPRRHVWTAPAVQGDFCDERSVRGRSGVRPVCAARWPLALMKSAEGSRSLRRALGSMTAEGFAFLGFDRSCSSHSIALATENGQWSGLA